ncbi:hypothetical protein D3C87_1315250 [compost metagenome]
MRPLRRHARDRHLDAVRIAPARDVDFRRLGDRRIHLDRRRQARRRHVEPHGRDHPLRALDIGPREAFQRTAARGGIIRRRLLIAREDRQVFLVPAVADAQVVRVGRGIVPLGRGQQQAVHRVIHGAQGLRMRAPDSGSALAPGPALERLAVVQVIGNAELADQGRSAAVAHRQPHGANEAQLEGVPLAVLVMRQIGIEQLGPQNLDVVPVAGVDRPLRHRLREGLALQHQVGTHLTEQQPVLANAADRRRHPGEEGRHEVVLVVQRAPAVDAEEVLVAHRRLAVDQGPCPRDLERIRAAFQPDRNPARVQDGFARPLHLAVLAARHDRHGRRQTTRDLEAVQRRP